MYEFPIHRTAIAVNTSDEHKQYLFSAYILPSSYTHTYIIKYSEKRVLFVSI